MTDNCRNPLFLLFVILPSLQSDAEYAHGTADEGNPLAGSEDQVRMVCHPMGSENSVSRRRGGGRGRD